MLDGDDLEIVALTWPDDGGWVLTLLGVIVFAVLVWFVWHNETDCEAKHCNNNTVPALVQGECVCIEKTKD